MQVSGQLHDTAAITPKGKVFYTRWIGGWVGPRSGIEMVVKI